MRGSDSIFADVFIPDVGMCGDIFSEQFAALAAVQIDDLDAVFTEPVEAAGEGAALTHHQCADAELTDKAAAVPAWRERSDHDEIAIAALAAGAAKGIRLTVDAGVALLHAAVVAAAD